jgi:hypothetical protein
VKAVEDMQGSVHFSRITFRYGSHAQRPGTRTARVASAKSGRVSTGPPIGSVLFQCTFLLFRTPGCC